MSVEVIGIDQLIKDLNKKLSGFTVDEKRKVMRGAAEMIAQEAKQNVRRSGLNDSGNLEKSIKIMPKFRGAPDITYVGPRVIRRFTAKTSQKRKDENPFYAHWIEYGTDPHDLSYRGKFVSEAKGTRSQHPGSRKFPYMRPAYDTKAVAAINKAMDDASKFIENR